MRNIMPSRTIRILSYTIIIIEYPLLIIKAMHH